MYEMTSQSNLDRSFGEPLALPSGSVAYMLVNMIGTMNRAGWISYQAADLRA